MDEAVIVFYSMLYSKCNNESLIFLAVANTAKASASILQSAFILIPYFNIAKYLGRMILDANLKWKVHVKINKIFF